MRLDYAQSGMILAKDLIDASGNLLLEKGIALTESYIARLKHFGIYAVPVEDSIANELKECQAISLKLRNEITECFRTLLKTKTEDLLEQDSNKFFREITAVTNSIIEEIEPQMANIMNVQVRQPEIDEVNHAVNVCLLSIITGLYLKLPQQALRNLAVGALMHDIGKSVIPLTNAGKSIEDERLHTLYGYNLLLSTNYNDTIARIAAEHHECYNGSGFPFGLENKNIHPLSRIVALSNDFDNAATQAQSLGTPINELVEQMMTAGNILYDIYILRAFFHTVAIYPIGAQVRLNTGELGYIVKNRAHFPLRPTVRVFKTRDYVDINLAHTTNIMITAVLEY
ncbi:MAG: HD domain-containing protein [Pelosinus sp.]|nr:HD domain-containing protein [Pelosinus sp.]